jgi:hypothetical protein
VQVESDAVRVARLIKTTQFLTNTSGENNYLAHMKQWNEAIKDTTVLLEAVAADAAARAGCVRASMRHDEK